MNAGRLVRAAAKRLGVDEAEVQAVFSALVEEMKEGLARLDEIRFPTLGKLIPKVRTPGGGRQVPRHPDCVLCQTGIKATPRHVKATHGMEYAAYVGEHGGPVFEHLSDTQVVHVHFHMFPGVRESLLERGPLAGIMEADRESAH